MNKNLSSQEKEEIFSLAIWDEKIDPLQLSTTLSKLYEARVWMRAQTFHQGVAKLLEEYPAIQEITLCWQVEMLTAFLKNIKIDGKIDGLAGGKTQRQFEKKMGTLRGLMGQSKDVAYDVLFSMREQHLPRAQITLTLSSGAERTTEYLRLTLGQEWYTWYEHKQLHKLGGSPEKQPTHSVKPRL